MHGPRPDQPFMPPNIPPMPPGNMGGPMPMPPGMPVNIRYLSFMKVCITIRYLLAVVEACNFKMAEFSFFLL